MINTGRLAAQSANGLVKAAGVFLLIFSILSIIHGFYSLPVSFKEGQFGFDGRLQQKPPGLLVTKLIDGYPADLGGLKPGDLILFANGKPFTPENALTIWGDAAAGSQMALVIRRGDQTLELRLTRKLMPMIERAMRVLYLLIIPALMLAYTLVGLWGIFRRPSFITNLIALVCFSFSAMISGIDLAIYSSPITEYIDYYKIKEIMFFAGTILTPAFWLFLFVNFPQKWKFYTKHKYLITFLVFLFPAISLAIKLMPGITGKYNMLPATVFIIGISGYIFSGIAILWRGAKQEKNILKKRQYQLMLFGIKYGALSIFLGFSCLYLAYAWEKYLFFHLGWIILFIFLATQLVGLILPFTFLNSFFRNKILETETALRRKLRYLAATFALFFIYLSASFFIGNWIIDRFDLTDTSFIVLVVLVLSLTFSPLRDRMLRRLEEKLYPEKTRYKNALRELIKKMSGYIEESQILENLTRWLSETMGIYPIFAVPIDRITAMNIPLKIHSPKSVLARTRDGSNFYWDEVPEEKSDIIDEDEKKWALAKGISITVPMISQGEQVGILSIGKKKNHEDFNGDDLEIFREAAYHTALAILNIKLQSEYLEKKRMDKELEVARNIQAHLMPRQIPEVSGLELHGEYKPCFEVGGDYFDIIRMDNDRTALVAADVSGKGAGAALLMSNLQASLRMAMSLSLPLRDIVYKINNIIYENSLPSQFITFFIGVWDNRSKSLQYINAGHNPPFILDDKNEINRLLPTGIALGIKENQTYRYPEIRLAVDDVLVIYTDGIEEFFNYRLEAFGIERMIESCKENKHLHPKEIIYGLFKRLKDFAGEKEAYHCDDLTIIAAKRID